MSRRSRADIVVKLWLRHRADTPPAMKTEAGLLALKGELIGRIERRGLEVYAEEFIAKEGRINE